jgi:hypothetical protein
MTGEESATSTQQEAVNKLEWKATNTPVDTHTAYALAVAVDEGEFTPEEAMEALEADENMSNLEWLRSDHYPGDEFYDKADIRYGGLYE